MKACNKFILTFICALAITLPLSGASTLKKPDSSSITMPSMPSSGRMTMPQIGSGFYVPGSKGFYSGTMPGAARKQADKKTADKTETSATTEVSSNEKISSLNNVVSSISRQQNLNQLTASDLSSLSSMGMLGSLGGLGLGNAAGGLFSSNASSQLNPSSILVNQNSQDSKQFEAILNELSALKTQIASDGTQLKDVSDKGFENTAKLEPKILRFVVNGYDVLSTCKKVYFSEQESDGTFLLTGDRKYVSENKNRSETFYFYFHTNGSEGGITKYKVTPAVSQDYENTYSYLYQLTQKNELEALRTGNLLSLRAGEGDWKLDMLISLDK